MTTPRASANVRGSRRLALVLLCFTVSAHAQLPQPKLDWIFPPGGQRGTQVDVTVGGADLDEARELIFSHPKLSARPKRTAADEFYPEGQTVPNQFTMEIGADVPLGSYEAQVVGRHGVSTVRIVHVTDFVEVADTGKNHTIAQAQPLALGSLITGRTEAEQDDFYAVELAEGDALTCEVWAQRIDSQAEIWVEVCRDDGAPLEAQEWWNRRDPVLSFTAPSTGTYFIRVQDATFRGGDPFIYRLAIQKQPTTDTETSSAPLVSVEVSHDSADEARYPTAAQPREIDAGRFFHAPEAASGDSGTIATEQQSNDTHLQAQKLGVPGELAGQFFPDGDTDWIELQSDAPGEVVIEVFSQRLGLPTDPLLTISRVVKNEQGEESLEQIAEADGGEARPATPGYNTASDDPYARLNLEKDSVYRVAVRDQNSSSRADPSNVYRLVIRRPQPDFQLLVAPASPWAADPKVPLRWPLTMRAGGALAIPVVALRSDGFASDIVVSAQGLPAGLTCEPVTIRAGKTEALLVLTADPQLTPWVGSIQIVGESQVDEARVTKQAVPASLAWDTTVANYDRARLNRRLVIAVSQERAPVAVRCESAELQATAGGVVKTNLAVSVSAELKEPLSLAPVGLPEGVTAKFILSEDRKSAELELTVGEKVPPGLYDFVVTGKPKVLYQNNPEAAARASEDQARITKLVESFKSEREQLVAAADASSPAVKQLDDRIARGEAALKEATERATKLAAAAQPAERQCDVVSNAVTLRIIEKAKE